MEITMRLARYVASVSLEEFHPDAVSAATAGIMDSVGCMLAGSREPLADVLCRSMVTAAAPHTGASVAGMGLRAPATEAALVNGSMAHALDYDDIAWPMKGHPSAVLLPAALALGEEENATGAEVLLAYMVGFETACAVGAAMSDAYFDDLGWHPTGPLGVLGAAAASARLLKLGVEQTAMAISLAASQAGGIRQNFGTMTKPLHAGLAARAGVTSARLIRDGFTAGTDALEGRFGFLRAFSGGAEYDEAAVPRRLGRGSYLQQDGVVIKKYPCCGSAHLAVDAVLELLRTRQLDPSQVEEVEVRVDFDPPRSLVHHRPETPLEAKFSMEYCVAAALLDRRIDLDTFAVDQVMRPQAQELLMKVRMARHPGFEGRPSLEEGYHRVRLQLKDGGVLEQVARRATEGSIRGATMEEVRSKFRDCASHALPVSQVERAQEMLEGLVALGNVRELGETLLGEGRGQG